MTDFLLVICGSATAVVLALAPLRQGGEMRPRPVLVPVKRGRR